MLKDNSKIAKINNFVSVEDLDSTTVLKLIKRASEFKEGAAFNLPKKQYFAANMFFENSTRTHHSFQIAEKKMGIDVIEFDANTSSLQKGETLYDTVLTLSALGVDVVVIRSTIERYWEELLTESIKCRIVNAGDGSGQHPSQCLLDLMTIQEEFTSFAGLKIAIVGDLVHSRVARSNMIMLDRLGAELYFSGPEIWHNSEFDRYGKFLPIAELIDQVDVVMLLRVQIERHHEKHIFSKEEYHQKYGLTEELAQKMKKTAIIMHPAPVNRDVEIASSLVEAYNSRIVTQMSNGVFARMAILEGVLGEHFIS